MAELQLDCSSFHGADGGVYEEKKEEEEEDLMHYFDRFKMRDRSILRVLKKNMNYNGFNVALILSILTTQNEEFESDRLKEWTLQRSTITNRDELLKDMEFVLTAFLTKCLARSKLERELVKMYEILEMLKEKYAIKSTVIAYGSALGSRDVTLGRIAACFPALVADLYHAGRIKCLLRFEDLGFSASSKLGKTISPVVFCPCLPALLPRTLVVSKRKNIVPVLMLVAIRTDSIVSYEGHMKIKNLWDAFKSAYYSNLLSEHDKKQKMAEYGLLNGQNNGFTEVLVNCRDLMKKQIKQSKQDDSDLMQVLDQIF